MALQKVVSWKSELLVELIKLRANLKIVSDQKLEILIVLSHSLVNRYWFVNRMSFSGR